MTLGREVESGTSAGETARTFQPDQDGRPVQERLWQRDGLRRRA